ncbi:hypothetical protein CDO44_21950 [Pigmentiphaga sp. NML080357]|uniref:hypothetical protein n=1 Tax=Pigmentiphaga sp. NML080357 TaxID=2008675 RepID=UPI000B4078E6|nr:hypothetical protein [Pigmentiphaga sp. NML080357]OVZ55826.1 hypothetical protein CDO44_21950 [Pigmentiphaga sp. NML080357]
MKSILTAIAAAVVLSGCAVYTPSGVVVAPAPGVYYEPPGYYDYGPVYPGPRFCPPGQAKKGRC